MNRLLTLIFFFIWLAAGTTLGAFCGYGQEVKPGKLVIVQDERIPQLIQKHVLLNSKQNGIMDGYRVQIFFDSGNESKRKAIDSRTEFLSKYPSVPAFLTFQEPFYKVRVGNFRSRVEADGFLEKIHLEYPNAFTVKDKINFPKVDQ
ncbi:MAG: SPOR domain-containing protein [Bacteroidetes bacterium]|nr:SPOR domain-containing protein [Bacteroidota bacterium]